MTSNQSLGLRGEDLACEHLEGLGMVVIERNWRCRHGEIDIVALDGSETSTLVFCEVKARSGLGYGAPLESITVDKVRRLRRLAAAWLAEHPSTGVPIRLDAVGVLTRRGYAPAITHVRGIG